MRELHQNGSVVSCVLVGDYEKVAAGYRKQGRFLVDRMSRHVNDTGGAMMPAGSADATMRLAEVIERLRTRYTLGYFSSNQARDGKFRQIAVKLSPEVEKREGKINVLVRNGYYSPKE
jgi:hypothetical protein